VVRFARWLPALAGALVLASSLAACGSSDDTATASSDRDKAEKARRDFERCMRKQGVEVPGPSTSRGSASGGGSGPRIVRGPREFDTPQGRRALKACQKYLDAARPKLSAEDRAKFRDAFVKFSACMRKAGVDVPPPPGAGGGQVNMRFRADDPRVRKAAESCRKLLPSGGRFQVGPGGGGGGPDRVGVGGPPGAGG
jgi:hypothetical protein